LVTCHIDPLIKKQTNGEVRQIKACNPSIQHRAHYNDVLKELRVRAKAAAGKEQAEEQAAKRRRLEGDGSADNPVTIQDNQPSNQTTLIQKVSPEQLQDAVGEMIIGDGLKLSIVNSMYFRRAMMLAASMGQQAVTQLFDGSKDIALVNKVAILPISAVLCVL
jgi:hypothetical protein